LHQVAATSSQSLERLLVPRRERKDDTLPERILFSQPCPRCDRPAAEEFFRVRKNAGAGEIDRLVFPERHA